MHHQVTEYIAKAPLAQKEIMETLRQLIHASVPNVKEEFKWSRPIFKATKDFAYFLANKNYVTLGFTKDIEKLEDSNNILEGTGKTMRHIKLRNVSDIDSALLKKWFTSITSD